MADKKNPSQVNDKAREIIEESRKQSNGKQFILWMAALVIGGALGWMNNPSLNELFNFIATIFTRMFQFIAVPTIALAVITTLSALGAKKDTKRIFAHTLVYTLLTTICSAAVGLALYLWIAPGNLPADVVGAGAAQVPQNLGKLSYYDHFLSVVPNNILYPFLSGNVLSVLFIAAAVGLALAFMPKTENREVLLKGINGLQEVLFTLIRAILYVLPVGILAFAGQLIVLPLFLLARGLNPVDIMKKMSPALAVALFTKSSAATLPVTLASAEQNVKVNPRVSRFVLPICTTINMNGCAAFILVTSLFVMQNSGMNLTTGAMISWLFVAPSAMPASPWAATS